MMALSSHAPASAKPAPLSVVGLATGPRSTTERQGIRREAHDR